MWYKTPESGGSHNNEIFTKGNLRKNAKIYEGYEILYSHRYFCCLYCCCICCSKQNHPWQCNTELVTWAIILRGEKKKKRFEEESRCPYLQIWLTTYAKAAESVSVPSEQQYQKIHQGDRSWKLVCVPALRK